MTGSWTKGGQDFTARERKNHIGARLVWS